MHLETKRLVLRDFVADDWQSVQAYAGDEEAVPYRLFGPCTEEETREHVCGLSVQPLQENRRIYDLAIVRRSDAQLIGGCDIGLLKDDCTEAAIGYILARDYWGQGYMTRAGRTFMTFRFNVLNAVRISADVDVENAASIRLLERLGMIRVGQRSEYSKGHAREVFMYAIERQGISSRDSI